MEAIDLKALVKFEELCEWRERFHTGGVHRMSDCDNHSNRIQRELRNNGYIVWVSDDPKNDGYAYGIAREEHTDKIDGTNETKYFLATDRTLGYDLSEDALLNL